MRSADSGSNGTRLVATPAVIAESRISFWDQLGFNWLGLPRTLRSMAWFRSLLEYPAWEYKCY